MPPNGTLLLLALISTPVWLSAPQALASFAPLAARAARDSSPSPTSVKTWLNRADVLMSHGQLTDAAALVERALRLKPDDASGWHRLARVRLLQSQYAEAAAMAAKSNSLTSDSGLEAANRLLIDWAQSPHRPASTSEMLRRLDVASRGTRERPAIAAENIRTKPNPGTPIEPPSRARSELARDRGRHMDRQVADVYFPRDPSGSTRGDAGAHPAADPDRHHRSDRAIEAESDVERCITDERYDWRGYLIDSRTRCYALAPERENQDDGEWEESDEEERD